MFKGPEAHIYQSVLQAFRLDKLEKLNGNRPVDPALLIGKVERLLADIKNLEAVRYAFQCVTLSLNSKL